MGDDMPSGVGFEQALLLFAEVALVVLVPATIIALGIRLAGIRPSRKPRDILRARLARGEITPDEFEAAMKALGD
jgi:uncharacterized membrane protein